MRDTPLIPIHVWQGQLDLWESEASLAYMVSPRAARATQETAIFKLSNQRLKCHTYRLHALPSHPVIAHCLFVMEYLQVTAALGIWKDWEKQ